MIEKTFVALKNTFLNTLVDKCRIEVGNTYTMKFRGDADFKSFENLGLFYGIPKPVVEDVPVLYKTTTDEVKESLECELCGVPLIYTGILVDDTVEYKIYTCPICKTESKELTETTKKEVIELIDTVMPEVIVEPEIEETKPSYQCEVCGKIYTQETRFKNHKCKNVNENN